MRHTVMYHDSVTTMFVAKGDKGAKKSVWLRRRIVVLREGQDCDEMDPKYIDTKSMVADAFTKYLPYPTWRRLMNYTTNLVRAKTQAGQVNGFGDTQ